MALIPLGGSSPDLTRTPLTSHTPTGGSEGKQMQDLFTAGVWEGGNDRNPGFFHGLPVQWLS